MPFEDRFIPCSGDELSNEDIYQGFTATREMQISRLRPGKIFPETRVHCLAVGSTERLTNVPEGVVRLLAWPGDVSGGVIRFSEGAKHVPNVIIKFSTSLVHVAGIVVKISAQVKHVTRAAVKLSGSLGDVPDVVVQLSTCLGDVVRALFGRFWGKTAL